MKTWIDSVMEISVSVIAIIFLGCIVTQVLLDFRNIVLVIGNALIYASLIGYIIKDAFRGVKKGGNKKKES